MKKILFYSLMLFSALGILSGCQKGNNYPGGVVSPYIPALDLRQIYQGSDVTLTNSVMYGSDKMTGVVISDFSGNNMPAGLLVVQDRRRLGVYRGIAINIGADAAKYVPGDSVVITLTNGILTRANGILQVTNVPTNNVTKISSGSTVGVTRATTTQVLAKPEVYESTYVAIVKSGFDPVPTPADKFAGDKLVNDGFDNVTLHTEATATFAGNSLPLSANFYGIVFNTVDAAGNLSPQLRLRNINDVVLLGSNNVSFAISGFISDVIGTDGNYEYVQFIATRDIDFSVTPFAVVICNNAGAATPLGFPANGWATGGTGGNIQFKTYKFNLTSGTAKKGTFFYVGGTGKLINGPATATLPASTSIASSNWIRTINYTTTNGDGFGTAYTVGLLANSGNASGIAVFEGTNVTAASTPIDVEFISTGGSLYTAGPPELGYRVANTDIYDVLDPITLKPQPYYRQGTNTLSLSYPAVSDVGYFYKLGGVYSARLGKWVKARSQTLVTLTKSSQLNEIEGEFPTGVSATQVKD